MADAVRLLHPPQEITEDPVFGRRLDRMLAAIEAQLDQPVGVAGPGSLDLMCALWRRGFQRVEAARGCTCGCADEKCELLLITGKDAAGIVATVEAVGSLLRPGGRLAVIAAAITGEGERQRLYNHLAHRGYRYRADAAVGLALVVTKPDAEDFASLR